ncbi:MAG: hypothetical protein WCX61_01785, partial [Candidatus Peribacteraceae bacterium]
MHLKNPRKRSLFLSAPLVLLVTLVLLVRIGAYFPLRTQVAPHQRTPAQEDMLSVEDIDEALLHERLLLAGDWFRSMAKETTGLLEYEYRPDKEQYSSKNNHVRQLATVWSMTALGAVLEDATLLNIANNVLENYLQHMSVCEEDYCFLNIDGDAKLAYNAFALLTLGGLPDFPDRSLWQERLARGILRQQQPDGSYGTYFRSQRATGQDYYPGEAMLALMVLYKETGTIAYRTSVELAFPYYREYWRANRNTAFIPWHTQAYALLFESTGDPQLAAFLFEMNDWLIANYQITQSKDIATIGAFVRGDPRNVTSVYAESINEALRMALLIGDTQHAEMYRESI